MSGIGIAIGIGFNGAARSVRQEATAYIARVEVDGGTVFLNAQEISNRLNEITCSQFPQFPQFIINYFMRVADDGGETFLNQTKTRDRLAQIICL